MTRYGVDGWIPRLADSTGNTRFHVWAELDGNNNLLTRYLHGDQPDQLFARQDSLVAYWYVTGVGPRARLGSDFGCWRFGADQSGIVTTSAPLRVASAGRIPADE